jgi:pyruvate kinase
MKIKILCTLGPASMRAEIVKELDDRGVDLFRINLSHIPLDELERSIEFLQRHSSTAICLDTNGAQVRCGVMASDVLLEKGASVRLESKIVPGTARRLTLWPPSMFEELKVGNIVSIDFDGALLRVTAVTPDSAQAQVIEQGCVKSNRAVTIQPPPRLPALTDKDVHAIELGVRLGLGHFALSFASSAEDVALLRSLVPSSAYVISKIESRAGVRQLDGIICASDAVLIDRGDLSREIPVEQVPIFQKHIIRRANTWNKPVFVATNLLESMVRNQRPTVAEANDIMNTLMDGAHGLVLASETAIGNHPIRAVDMIRRVIHAFEHSTSQLIVESAASAYDVA